MAFAILVLNQDGNPVVDTGVELHFTDFRGVSSEIPTDEFGAATFIGYADGDANVFVAGVDCGMFNLKNDTTITVRL